MLSGLRSRVGCVGAEMRSGPREVMYLRIGHLRHLPLLAEVKFLFSSIDVRSALVLKNNAGLPMKLYLIRHGETVDNVAGLYAGSRDSTLTNHGVEQTERLGEYLARNGVKFTHVFASPLSRAYKTAEAVAT